MKKYLIQLEVELPENFSEEKIDTAIADIICDKFNGQIIDSKEFIEIKDEE